MTTITIKAINGATTLFTYEVPFESKINVQTLLETAFDSNQTQANPDPFSYDLEYFGYSQINNYPGFLGYSIESINGLNAKQSGNVTYYWELLVNDIVSTTGIDTTFPNPNATVTLSYVEYSLDTASSHQKTIHERRIARDKV